eukprot:8307369-Heterocapsa_arctica.AAC.1
MPRPAADPRGRPPSGRGHLQRHLRLHCIQRHGAPWEELSSVRPLTPWLGAGIRRSSRCSAPSACRAGRVMVRHVRQPTPGALPSLRVDVKPASRSAT